MPVIDTEIPLGPDVERTWHAWLEVTKTRCHINYELEGGRLDTHIASCLENSMATADRVTRHGHPCPRKILEVGSSTGFNCLALSHLYPDAEIYGIEPDSEAVLVAKSMAEAAGKNKVHFQQGVGENLPYENEEFDLIICLTVIEHVGNVENVISEMARVLSPGGMLRLEAPNYVWPYEPHLSLWCIPLLGKKFARLLALMQGKSKNVAYLDHLQFVTPGRLESAFKKNGLVWENLVQVKLEQVFEGDSSQIKAYTRIARLMRIPAKLGLGRFLVKLIMATKLYPSVLYAVKKASHV